ncbi:hypothetical protein N657DRAFT_639752 [Parathielavia appendiculata]|uniref:Protein YAE1 n=1 Tax=Parathielavia appendiculata TaxID=2587402 RepID=A0AAN6UA51_9PEZI|nr:hypothetical protein N657DRAFT_639752 [Parathielavia appendiculata]
MTSHNPAASDPHRDQDISHDQPTESDSNNLDDIWASDDQPTTYSHPHPHPHGHHQQYYTPPQEVSDIPRLSQAHTTAGYRDGITLAKARTAQQGFDEGYGLGATIGARAGQLLGVLEGLAAAVGLHALSLSSSSSSSSSPSSSEELPPSTGTETGYYEGSPPQWTGRDEARRIEGLLNEARRELSVQGVFDGAFWAADGNWRYDVGGSGGGLGEDGVVFSDVAEAHPLLRKWGGIVRAEAARYGVDWEVLKDEIRDVKSGEDEEDEREREERARKERGGQPAARGREALAW